MMRGVFLAAAALLVSSPASPSPVHAAGRSSSPALQLAMAYPQPSAGRVPGILVLGGAEGGDRWAKAVARRLAEEGYVALPQAYFHAPGLQDQLQLIPIEQLRAGVDLLVRDARVDPRRIAVLGLSKGAEAALVLASVDRRIRAVVAGSPSDVVWQGIDRKNGAVKSSWSVAGRPLPFVPFASCDDCRSLGSLYVRSREAAGTEAPAAIPVERIRGPILLFSSETDAVWPSGSMAASLKLRLERKRFPHAIVLRQYPMGGHFTFGPLAEDEAEADAEFGGGTPDGILAARRESWVQMISFLHESFPDKPKRH
jgi:dienelactone hydrolase